MVQAVAPARELVREGHVVQAVEPATAEKVPWAQVRHAVLAGQGLYEPAGQVGQSYWRVQAVAPPVEYIPVGHIMQELWPTID